MRPNISMRSNIPSCDLLNPERIGVGVISISWSSTSPEPPVSQATFKVLWSRRISDAGISPPRLQRKHWSAQPDVHAVSATASRMQVHTLRAITGLNCQRPKANTAIYRALDIMTVPTKGHSADSAIDLEQLAPGDQKHATFGAGERQSECLRLCCDQTRFDAVNGTGRVEIGASRRETKMSGRTADHIILIRSQKIIHVR